MARERRRRRHRIGFGRGRRSPGHGPSICRAGPGKHEPTGYRHGFPRRKAVPVPAKLSSEMLCCRESL
jgi:hypothetical protein